MISEDNNGNHLFELRLSTVGSSYIRRSLKIIPVIYISTSVIYLISFGTLIYNLIANGNHANRNNFSIADYISMGMMVVNLVGLICYFQFISFLNRSIRNNDEELFNKAFGKLYLNVCFFSIVTLLDMANCLLLVPDLLKTF